VDEVKIFVNFKGLGKSLLAGRGNSNLVRILNDSKEGFKKIVKKFSHKIQ
jgi:hypothetical protein